MKVSKPRAKFVRAETSGLADVPNVEMPPAAARSGRSGRRLDNAPAAQPTRPWSRGGSPVRIVATDGIVHDDCAIACSNTTPVAASASSVGLGLGRAP